MLMICLSLGRETYTGLQAGSCFRIRDGHWLDALLFGTRGVVGAGTHIPWSREIYSYILSRFQMGDCRPMSTPMITNWKKLHASETELVDPTLYRQLIGSLMYLVNTRPDICFAVNSLSQFMVEPSRVHWMAAKRVFRYLQGTLDYGLDYKQGDGVGQFESSMVC